MSTRSRSVWRSLVVVTLAVFVSATAADTAADTTRGADASDRSPLQVHRATKQRLIQRVAHVRRRHRHTAKRWTAVVERSNEGLRMGLGREALINVDRWNHLERSLLGARYAAFVHVHRSRRRMQRKVRTLRARRASVQAWIDTWGVFEVCPVRGPTQVVDDFGVMVRLPGVPVHTHMGNDIAAIPGAPISAPFDGFASASASPLGGMEVRVHGEAGYVYNAHLSGYGTLGAVRAGDVIGYVGSTGDATAPHDHFEWHPDGGDAVDPHPYLAASCG